MELLLGSAAGQNNMSEGIKWCFQVKSARTMGYSQAKAVGGNLTLSAGWKTLKAAPGSEFRSLVVSRSEPHESSSSRAFVQSEAPVLQAELFLKLGPLGPFSNAQPAVGISPETH